MRKRAGKVGFYVSPLPGGNGCPGFLKNGEAFVSQTKIDVGAINTILSCNCADEIIGQRRVGQGHPHERVTDDCPAHAGADSPFFRQIAEE